MSDNRIRLMRSSLLAAATVLFSLGCGGSDPVSAPTSQWVSFGGRFLAESFNGRPLPTQVGLHFCDDGTRVPLIFESGWIDFQPAPPGRRSSVEILSDTSWECPSGPGMRSPSPTLPFLATSDSVLFVSINLWAARDPLRPTFNLADSTGVIVYR